jgi:hypothetical protein
LLFISPDRQVRCPVFVIHGSSDEICPVSHAVSLFEQCPNPWQIWIIPRANHDNIEIEHLNELLEYLRAFINYVETSYSPPSGKYADSELEKLLSDGPMTGITTKSTTKALFRSCT